MLGTLVPGRWHRDKAPSSEDQHPAARTPGSAAALCLHGEQDSAHYGPGRPCWGEWSGVRSRRLSW